MQNKITPEKWEFIDVLLLVVLIAITFSVGFFMGIGESERRVTILMSGK